jgi:hemerythrin-like domain-containing protein
MMTRRHDALIPLTHDHHHALHELRLLRQAADASEDDRVAAARTFLDFFRGHSVQHFREEEEEIFPVVIHHRDAPVEGILHILKEHVEIHALVRKLADEVSSGAPSADAMRELAEKLRSHIRFEEDELFPAIERIATEELQDVQLPERQR